MGSCPLGESNLILTRNELTKIYKFCPITYVDITDEYWHCRKCGRSHRFPNSLRIRYTYCVNGWVVCGHCLNDGHCLLGRKLTESELPDSRVGKVKWVLAQ